MFARFVTSIIGFVLIVYGVIAAISPLPLGVPLVVLGLLMIAGANPAARPLIRRMRARWRWFDAIVSRIGEKSPENIRTVIEETEPAPTYRNGENENSEKPRDYVE